MELNNTVKDNHIWLVNLPHAGGSTIIFKGWNKKIRCNVLNVEYAGHWSRMKEPLLHSFSELAKDVLNTMKMIPKGDEIIFFGHSIGAIMAWYISPIIIQEGYKIKGLFLSASQNPGAFPEKSILKSASDKDMLRLIGYKVEEHDEAINNQFMQIFLPILKNDMEVCKSFVCDRHFVDVDSVVLYGIDDIFTDTVEMKKWKEYVRLTAMYEFPGEHLFIEDKANVDKILELINNMIDGK